MPDAVGTTHHVKINGSHFLIQPGTYRKRPAPMFGARFTTGDPDYNNLSAWQHWVQQCWVGGFGAETWKDDAMFHQGVGVDTSQHEVMTLTRDLGPSDGTRATNNWDLDLFVGRREFIVFNNILWCLSRGSEDGVTPARLFKLSGVVWVQVREFSSRSVRGMCLFNGELVFAAGATGGITQSYVARMNTAESFVLINVPGVNSIASSVTVYRGKLYATFGRQIWRLKPDWTWDGSTAFYTAEDADQIECADVHLGFLYFASNNSHILRTDGQNTFDLWAFEQHVRISDIRSFDGKLFVSASEDLAGTNSAEAVLYQFSGSAVTELKRWGRVGKDITPGKIRAIHGKLFFGASSLLGMGEGFGIAMYDPVEDAYHTFAANQDEVTFVPGTESVNVAVDDVYMYDGNLYCSVRGYGIFRTPWTFQDVSRFQATYDTTGGGIGVGSQNGGWYESSDFEAGTPGLLKLWNAITVHIDLPTVDTAAYVDYSVDGGVSWVAVGAITKTGAATRYAVMLQLQAAGLPLRSVRLKYRVTLRTTNTLYSPQLRGVVVRYLPIPEPNWQWDMQLVLSESQQLLDGSVQELDAAAIAVKLAALETPFRAQDLVNFVDADGTEWVGATGKGCLIQNLVEQLPSLGPSSDGPYERIVSLTLLETVESYA